ncbi:MAG: hypothetical protein MZV64_20035 [Ignavibacteriales bacterium]|nr:hypothetical protein [Ignavibacteriales bacterium]
MPLKVLVASVERQPRRNAAGAVGQRVADIDVGEGVGRRTAKLNGASSVAF